MHSLKMEKKIKWYGYLLCYILKSKLQNMYFHFLKIVHTHVPTDTQGILVSI